MADELYYTPAFVDKATLGLHSTEIPTMRAHFAMKLMEHLAISAAEADGEDTAGRQKLRLLTPVEVATRACNIAAAAYQQFEDRDWLLTAPPYEECKKLGRVAT